MKSLLAHLAVIIAFATAPIDVDLWIFAAYLGFWVLVLLGYFYFLLTDA